LLLFTHFSLITCHLLPFAAVYTFLPHNLPSIAICCCLHISPSHLAIIAISCCLHISPSQLAIYFHLLLFKIFSLTPCHLFSFAALYTFLPHTLSSFTISMYNIYHYCPTKQQNIRQCHLQSLNLY
jgi:hypothetical protein